jgi:hypothetical protein
MYTLPLILSATNIRTSLGNNMFITLERLEPWVLANKHAPLQLSHHGSVKFKTEV